MDISARSYLTTGISLTAATAIAFTPVALPALHPAVPIPDVIASDIELTVNPSDIVAAIANVAGVPGQTLIGVAATIETLFDVGFSGLIDATDDPTVAASLTILKTLSVDAYAMLAHNLGRINPVITGTTGELGSLLTTALTASLQNVLVALVNVVNDPLSAPSYVGLVAAGLASGQLLAGNGLAAVQGLGDAGFDVAGIAVDELTFQFNNAVSGLSALATQLGDASGSTTAGASVDVVNLGAATDAVQQPELTERSAGQSFQKDSLDSSAADDVTTSSFSDEFADNDVPVVEDVDNQNTPVDDATEDAGESTAVGETAANDHAAPTKDAARDDQGGNIGADDGAASAATND